MNKVNKYIYWIPRILSILFILFLAMMSLDIFDMGLGFWDTILGLFMHNIPAIVLLIVLIISWRYEIVGGVAFILAGLIYIGFVLAGTFEMVELGAIAIIAGPAILIGVLFLINWYKKLCEARVGGVHSSTKCHREQE